MLEIVLFFLGFAFLLYTCLAGADFGAGIVELFSYGENRKKAKQTIYRVIGPVWEANHIWVIIVIVILWIGFPGFYNKITLYLHMPITLVLMGITLRGVAFVVRHYDAYTDRSHAFYDWTFRISSFVTPILLGMTLGALTSGNMMVTENYENIGFKALFVDSWFNMFSLLLGLFYASLCAFFSSILLIGEATDDSLNTYLKKSITVLIVSVFLGSILLIYGFLNEHTFITNLIHHPLFTILILLSFLVLCGLFIAIKKRYVVLTRTLAGIQMGLIFMAPMVENYPYLLITKDTRISILNGLAAESVIQLLAIALVVASILILPGLFHLFQSFDMIKILKIKSKEE